MLPPIPHHLPLWLANVAGYWQRKYDANATIPRLTDIDLMDLYIEAPHLFIADRIEQADTEFGHVYRWRYWGTAVRNLTGVETTGKLLHETHQAQGAAEAIADYDAVLAEGRPSYWKRNVRTMAEDRSFLRYERIVFPLSASAGTTGHILGVCVFDNPAYAAIRTGEELSPGKIGLFETDPEC